MDDLSSAVRSGQLDEWRGGEETQGLAVVCAGGMRSAQATVRLTKVFGFTKVASLKGGMAAWGADGLPVEL
jgi:rhodanese-related sulfurtransferase